VTRFDEAVRIGLLMSQGVATVGALSYAVVTRILVSPAATVMGLLAMLRMGMLPPEEFGPRSSCRQVVVRALTRRPHALPPSEHRAR
jgi:hypothetical protein